MSALELITLLVCLSALFMFLNIRVLKLPSTIGLMLLAIGLSTLLLALGQFSPSVNKYATDLVSQFDFAEVLLDLMLSFLLFAGAIQINLKVMKRQMTPILILATVGVILSTFIIGYGMYLALPLLGYNIKFIYCLLFGALISPTDPIAVLSLLKRFNLSKDLETKIAGESLFNDGVGVVVFLTILQIATGGSGHGAVEETTFSSVAALFGQEVIGGAGLGALLGWLGFKLLDAIENEHVELEVLVTLSLVMGGTWLASYFHFSAPLAMVVLGLFLSNQGRTAKKEEVTGQYVFKFWHLMDEALNAILFILIGLEMVIIPFSWMSITAGLIAILIVLTARFIGVSTPIKLLSFKRQFDNGTIAILTWGGLRGGISVALALSLPDFPFKDLIVTMTYVVVIFSISVQGLTIPKLLNWIETRGTK